MSPHVFLLIFRRTVNRWKQLLHFCSPASAWVLGDIPGDMGLIASAYPAESSPHKAQLRWPPLERTCFQPARRLHYLFSLRSKIPFDQVCSYFRVRKEYLVLVLLASSQPLTGVHLLFPSTCLNLSSGIKKGGVRRGIKLKEIQVYIGDHMFQLEGEIPQSSLRCWTTLSAPQVFVLSQI